MFKNNCWPKVFRIVFNIPKSQRSFTDLPQIDLHVLNRICMGRILFSDIGLVLSLLFIGILLQIYKISADKSLL